MESLTKATQAEDLNLPELKISSLKGSTSEKFVRTFLPKATSLPVDNYEQGVAALMNGSANVMVADYPICQLTALRNPTANLFVLKDPMTIEPIGMALPADDPLLLNFVDNYFNALAMAGVLKKMEDYWFNSGGWLANMK